MNQHRFQNVILTFCDCGDWIPLWPQKAAPFPVAAPRKTILVHRMNQERMILVKDQSCRLWSFDRMIVFYTS